MLKDAIGVLLAVNVGPGTSRLAATPISGVIDWLLPSKKATAAARIAELADEIADEMMANVKAAVGSREFGATHYAMITFGQTIEKAKLKLEDMINCGLDPHKLETLLRQSCPDEHKNAGTTRAQAYDVAIGTFCELILAESPALPGFDLAFCRHVLKRLPQ